jgi:hypothetical protein
MDNKVLVEVAARVACQMFRKNKQIPSLESFEIIVTESVANVEPTYRGLTVSEAAIVENAHADIFGVFVDKELFDLGFILKAINESYTEDSEFYSLVRFDAYVESARLTPYELIEIGKELNFLGYSTERYDRMYLQLRKHDKGVAKPIHEEELLDSIDGYRNQVFKYVQQKGYRYADGKADN